MTSLATAVDTTLDQSTVPMLTTFDNPYDPHTQFTPWLQYDISKGYNTCAYLGRIARTSDQLSDQENNAEVERAIKEIIMYDFMNIYKKV